MKISKFDRAACRTVNDGAMEALEAYAASMGLAVEREGRGSFDANNFSFKIKFVTGGSDGAVEQQRQAFARAARWYGLEEQDFNAEFQGDQGRRYRLTGINTRAKRNPLEAVDVVTGKGWRLPEVYKDRIIAARKKA